MKGIFCNIIVAVKIPNDGHEAFHPSRLQAICNELRIFRYLRHPNIVTFHGAIIGPMQKKIAVVLELVQGTDLHHFLIGVTASGCGKDLSPLKRYQVMLGTCHALMYMHSRHPHLVHGDLTSRNIVVEIMGDVVNPKLLDFGLSRVLTQRSKHMRPLGGTLVWMAPELVFKDSAVKCSADIYSLGRLIAFIATSTPPMSGLSVSMIKRAIASGDPPLPTWPKPCPFEHTCNPLVRACLRANEAKRPCILEVHEKLLRLPVDLGLANVDEKGHFLRDVQFMADNLGERSVCPKHDPVASPLCSDESVQQNAGTGSGFLAGIEEEPLAAGAMPSSGKAELRFPQLPRTSQQAMEASLIAAVSCWNSNMPLEACCERHAGIRKAQGICHAILAQPCTFEPLPRAAGQCRVCGLLGSGVTCYVCDVSGAPEDDLEAQSRLAL